MVHTEFNDPDQDVKIDGPHRGSIRCRKLLVTPKGSIIGNIEALEVSNHGRIQGRINASVIFLNNEGSYLRGPVYAPSFGVHPKSKHEGHHSMTTPLNLEEDNAYILGSDIERAVEEGIRRQKAKEASSPARIFTPRVAETEHVPVMPLVTPAIPEMEPYTEQAPRFVAQSEHDEIFHRVAPSPSLKALPPLFSSN